MASGVVKVGRRTYAVGLYWQPSPSGRVAQAAREAAQQPGQKADYYCVRGASKSVAIPQYGLGQEAMGHRVGMATLAASLANVQPGSWAGAFRLREGTWVVVVRDDLIAPDGDFLFDNDDQARDRLLQEVSLGGVQRVYAPDGWAVPGSDPTPLPLLLQDRADCMLQPVTVPLKLIMYGVAGLAVLGLLIFLFMQWQADQERIAAEAEAAAAGPISAMTQTWQWPPAEKAYERRWEKQARMAEVFDTCRKLFEQARASELGWRIKGIVCSGGSLTVDRDMEKAGRFAAYPDNGKVSSNLKELSQTYTTTEPSPRGAEDLLTRKEITEIALKRGWAFELRELPDDQPSVKPPPNVKDPPPPPPPPWVKRGVHISGQAPPWGYLPYFENIPGLMINAIEYNGKSWNFEATIYEMRGGS